MASEAEGADSPKGVMSIINQLNKFNGSPVMGLPKPCVAAKPSVAPKPAPPATKPKVSTGAELTKKLGITSDMLQSELKNKMPAFKGNTKAGGRGSIFPPPATDSDPKRTFQHKDILRGKGNAPSPAKPVCVPPHVKELKQWKGGVAPPKKDVYPAVIVCGDFDYKLQPLDPETATEARPCKPMAISDITMDEILLASRVNKESEMEEEEDDIYDDVAAGDSGLSISRPHTLIQEMTAEEEAEFERGLRAANVQVGDHGSEDEMEETYDDVGVPQLSAPPSDPDDEIYEEI